MSRRDDDAYAPQALLARAGMSQAQLRDWTAEHAYWVERLEGDGPVLCRVRRLEIDGIAMIDCFFDVPSGDSYDFRVACSGRTFLGSTRSEAERPEHAEALIALVLDELGLTAIPID
ncbi:hypothetical protein ACM61V_04340 [Sphingomonas sp. TX0543]|uniref:hypothetical protein n=1 Tax=unclassified Sphingomonas TaxID=196159 RepID=UPI0010F71CA1|nr:hypothetical protein [Sphingomonas sp. 3P27F8]